MFQFVLVDEYQDTNYVQYMIIKHLSAKNKNICVVGDDAQSIYSFRGARIENILNFKNDYPQYKLYKLEQNYRSTQTIVKAANSLINNNRDQISKKVWSDNESGDKIQLIQAATDNEEGYVVSSLIQDSIYSDHYHYSDYAILYRTNAQSRIFEESLRKLNIPYIVYGSLSFYHRKEIKDLLAYFRLTVNPHDEEALLRIINYPARGIGNTTISKLEGLSDKFDKRIWEIMLDIDKHPDLFNKGTLSKLSGFVRLINGYRDNLKRMEAFDLAFTIAESSGILKDLHVDKSPENISKYENIQELLNGIKEYTDSQEKAESSTLDAYLQNVALLTDQDSNKEEDRNKVTIMTVHSAKGLEFKQIFVAGLEEDLFPSRLSSSTREELEEERRLFYVAITRAMKKVTLSYASSRYKWGVLLNCTPSRFLKEIDPVHLSGAEKIASPMQSQPMGNNTNQFYRPASKKTVTRPAKQQNTTPRKAGTWSKYEEVKKSSTPQKPFEADDPQKIQMGMEVEHPRFGTGKIIGLEGEGTNRKANVFFRQAGQKQLLLKFAKLKIVKTI